MFLIPKSFNFDVHLDVMICYLHETLHLKAQTSLLTEISLQVWGVAGFHSRCRFVA